jgi:arylsulfatase A-like enzyme
MIYWAPTRWQASVNDSQVASLVDIMPTVLEACGVAPHDKVEGRSLTSILEGSCDALDDPSAIIETSGLHVGVRTPTHLYGILLEEDWTTVDDEAHQFFDLRTDPLEMNNLARTDEQSALASELRTKVLAWHTSTPRKDY